MISAYKDPVEYQHVIKIVDKIITGFFVITLGILWYSTRCFVKHNQYRIVIYDVLGNQIYMDGIRTNFNTPKVANNYILEYQKRFPHYNFSMATEMPIIKKSWMLEKIKNN